MKQDANWSVHTTDGSSAWSATNTSRLVTCPSVITVLVATTSDTARYFSSIGRIDAVNTIPASVYTRMPFQGRPRSDFRITYGFHT